MKKFLAASVLSLCLLASNSAFAGIVSTVVVPLKDSAGTAINSYSLTSGVAVYSETLRTQDNAGFATLLVIEDKPGGAGDVDISTQYSIDGINWYTVYVSDMAGTVTVEGNLITTLQNASRWIVFTPRLAPYMRYKFDPDADSRITAVSIYQRG